MKILHIDSSPMLKHSSSRKLSQALVEALCQRFAQATIIHRDVGLTPPPHLREETFLALCGKAECENAQIQQEVNDIHAAIDELASCDVLIIGAPMINHSVSSGLKTWIDQVCQAGLTFRFTSAGAVGLLTDKPTFIVSTRGGIYCDEAHLALDHQESYLQATLKLMGITNTHILRAEGVDKTQPG
ncbi:TPA: NAD(P)H-dependent oxidoreductase, partial [Escherichia coli]|nr:NAD(P)H-dependent oxidoreductase [Escherichia coli]